MLLCSDRIVILKFNGAIYIPLRERALRVPGICFRAASTLEGPAYLFFAYDAFGDYIMSLSLETDDRPETVLRNLYFLLEDPYFTTQSVDRFTLVMGQYQELGASVEQIVSLVGGSLLFNEAFTDHLVFPALRHLRRKLQRHPKRRRT